MTERSVERRRTARVRVSGGAHLVRTSVVSVRLLDIGSGGLLLESAQPLEASQYGHLSARLGDVAIDEDVEIRRVSTQPKGQGYRAGARFVSPDASAQRAMQEFLAAVTR